MAENRVESQGAETGWARLALPRAGGAQGGAGLERTFIEEGAVFEGTLRVHHDLYLDSHFRGTIETTGTLSVGPAGSVEGRLVAREVVIAGAVVGDVEARSLLTVRASGRLTGDVETACLEIERHAFFSGSTKMTRPVDALRDGAETAARPAAPAPAAP